MIRRITPPARLAKRKPLSRPPTARRQPADESHDGLGRSLRPAVLYVGDPLGGGQRIRMIRA